MKKKEGVESISLGHFEKLCVARIKKQMPYGWFSHWVNQQIRINFFDNEKYRPHMVNIAKAMLVTVTEERNRLDEKILEFSKIIRRSKGKPW